MVVLVVGPLLVGGRGWAPYSLKTGPAVHWKCAHASLSATMLRVAMQFTGVSSYGVGRRPLLTAHSWTLMADVSCAMSVADQLVIVIREALTRHWPPSVRPSFAQSDRVCVRLRLIGVYTSLSISSVLLSSKTRVVNCVTAAAGFCRLYLVVYAADTAHECLSSAGDTRQ